MTMAGCAGGVISPTSESSAAISSAIMSGSFRVEAVTADGYAIVSDLKAKTVNAVQLSTKKSTVILSTPLVDPGSVTNGSTVLLWHDTNTAGGGAQLTSWTSGGGAHLLSPNALANAGYVSFSDDGQHLTFIERIDANTDQIVLDTPGHVAPQVLVKGSPTCPGHKARFVPGGGWQKLVVGYCPVGTTERLIVAYNLAANTSVTLGDFGPDLYFRLDPTGSRALVHGTAGSSLVALDGSTRELIDAGAVDGRFFPDGIELVYTSGGALKRVATGGLPETMLASGAGGLYWVTSDSAWVYYYNAQSDLGVGDIKAANLLVDGAPLVINADGSGALEAPSSDQHHSMFYVGSDAARHLGVFTTMPFGGAGQRLGTGLSVIDGDYELGNDRVVFNDQYVAGTTTTPEHVSLESIDFSQATPTVKLLVAGADPTFLPTPDNTTAVYTTSDPVSGGLYTVPIP